MNRYLVIFSILVVSIIAYTDARDRLKELDSVAANTPAQVEMKPIFNNNLPDKEFKNNVQMQQPQQQSEIGKKQEFDKNNQQNEQSLKDAQQKRNNDLFK